MFFPQDDYATVVKAILRLRQRFFRAWFIYIYFFLPSVLTIIQPHRYFRQPRQINEKRDENYIMRMYKREDILPDNVN